MEAAIKATTKMPSRSSTMTSSALMRKKQTTLILQQIGKTRNCCVSNLENTFHSPFTFRTFILIISKLITSGIDNNLQNKRERFIQETRTRKAVHLTMITTMGLMQNSYAWDIQSVVTMDDLFI